jgi:hypothetical protein
MQVMMDILWFKLKEFTQFKDIGKANRTDTKGMYGEAFQFIVMKKLGISLFDIYDHN